LGRKARGWAQDALVKKKGRSQKERGDVKLKRKEGGVHEKVTVTGGLEKQMRAARKEAGEKWSALGTAASGPPKH